MNIKRNIINKLHSDLSKKYVTILVGPRQVGKTFLLREVEKEAKQRGLKTAFFDLEQPSDLTLFNRTESEILEFLSHAGDVIFIDEFHYLKNASHLFKALYDRRTKIKIFASGSSALEIHAHLKESLAGRKMIYPIHPCSLEEISQVVEDPLSYYITFGGMPGTIHFSSKNERQQLLVDILQSYLLKDIKALLREENLRAFNHLLYLLAANQGNVSPIENLSNEVGMTAPTVSKYLDIMAQTYVNFPVHSYSKNFGNELKKSKKYYLYDLGIRNVLLKNFAPLNQRSDAGTIIESLVFSELQQQLTPESEIRFWRLKSGEEVDFVWIQNQVACPIEIKQNWKSGDIPDGLKAYLRRYPKTKLAFVVSTALHGETRYQETPIFYRSVNEVNSIPLEIES